MGEALAQVLSQAVGVAISPVPIIAVVLMLFSPAAARNGLAFVAGWVTALAVVGLLVLALGPGTSDGEASAGSGWLRVAVGVVFLFLAWRQWSGRPKPGVQPALPPWMAAVDRFTAVRSFGLGALLAGPNPKNLGLTLAAATTIGASGVGTGAEVATLVVYVCLASLTVAGPVLLSLVLGRRAEAPLEALRQWLVANNSAVMTVLFLVLGAKVLGDGLAVLA